MRKIRQTYRPMIDTDFDYYVNEVEKLCLGMKGN